MNLHDIASNVIKVVNPMTEVSYRASTDYTIAPGGEQVPQYAAPVTVLAQVQDLSQRDLRQLESLNIQGSTTAIYVSGRLLAAVRPSRRGGDLITFPDGSIWLTTAVLEAWPEWCRVSATLQNGS